MTDTPRRRLLVVDDEPLILEVLTEHFKSDYEVETALNGADALRSGAFGYVPKPFDFRYLDHMLATIFDRLPRGPKR